MVGDRQEAHVLLQSGPLAQAGALGCGLCRDSDRLEELLRGVVADNGKIRCYYWLAVQSVVGATRAGKERFGTLLSKMTMVASRWASS